MNLLSVRYLQIPARAAFSLHPSTRYIGANIGRRWSFVTQFTGG